MSDEFKYSPEEAAAIARMAVAEVKEDLLSAMNSRLEIFEGKTDAKFEKHTSQEMKRYDKIIEMLQASADKVTNSLGGIHEKLNGIKDRTSRLEERLDAEVKTREKYDVLTDKKIDELKSNINGNIKEKFDLANREISRVETDSEKKSDKKLKIYSIVITVIFGIITTAIALLK